MTQRNRRSPANDAKPVSKGLLLGYARVSKGDDQSMAAFFDNVGRAFAQITDAASATMGPTIDRWLCGFQPYSRELLTERLWSHRASTAVSYLLQS